MSRRASSLNSPQHTAIHEAGHAVIGRVLTLVCGKASILPDEDSAGHSITADPWECTAAWERRGRVRADNAVWYGRIITYLAAAEAEAVILGSIVVGGDGADRYEIEEMSNEVECDAGQWNRIEARLRAMTRMLVRRHRDRIESVAEAFLAKKNLSATAIDRLAGRSVNDVKSNAPFLLELHRRRQTGP